MKIYATIFLISFLPFVFGQNYTLEDKLLPLVNLNDVNLKFLRNLFHVGAGFNHLSPYGYLFDKYSQNQLNSTLFRQLLQDGLQLENAMDRNRYSKCSDDLAQILFNLDAMWALKMLDANGKLASGLLLGGLTWPGRYRECKSVFSPLDSDGRGYFHGKYCVVTWQASLPERPQMNMSCGICVPDSCQDDQILIAVRNIVHLTGQLPFLKKYDSVLELKSVECKTDSKPLDAAAIVYITIVCMFLFMVLLGTLLTLYRYFTKTAYVVLRSNSELKNDSGATSYGSIQTAAKSGDLLLDPQKDFSRKDGETLTSDGDRDLNEQPQFKRSQKRSWKSVLLCFSAIDNAEKILEVKANNSQLQTIHGIRFLSLTWVILGHSYINAAAYISNKTEVLEDLDSFAFQMVLQAPFSVDSFFLLSGLLLTYLFLKEADKKNGKINWLYFYLHRLWRLTPVYFLVVAFYMLVFKYIGSGPFWDDNYGDSCRHTWWYYLLYINNFIPIKQMCVGWSWYLANDMQFYLISPVFLYLLWRKPKIGILVVLSLLVGSWITTGVLTSVHDINPFLAGVTEVTDLKAYENKMWYSFDIIYDKPYCRIGPYLVGVLCGYLLYKARNNKRFLQPWHQVYGWVGATFYSAVVIFGLYHAELSTSTSVAYNTFSRSAFAIGLAWLIFACETGHGGLVSKLLSLKIWVPFSRLTYCAYLVHPIVIHYSYMSLKTMMYFTHFTMVINFLGFSLVAYALAFLVSICFESPMMNIEKLLLKR